MSIFAKVMISLVLIASVVLVSSCDQSQQGAGIGAGVGALAGGIIGHQSGKGGQGALIGSAVGALAGNSIGAYKDKKRLRKEKELAEAESARLRELLELEKIKAENDRMRTALENK